MEKSPNHKCKYHTLGSPWVDVYCIMIFCDGYMSFFCHFLQHFELVYYYTVLKVSTFNQTALGPAYFESFGDVTAIYFEFFFHTSLQQMSA